MEFKEYVELEVNKLETLNERANLDVNNVVLLKDKLAAAGINPKISEDSVKVLAYLGHIKAAKGVLKDAALSLGKDFSTLHSKDPSKNTLLGYGVPEELWRFGKEEK